MISQNGQMHFKNRDFFFAEKRLCKEFIDCRLHLEATIDMQIHLLTYRVIVIIKIVVFWSQKYISRTITSNKKIIIFQCVFCFVSSV